MALPPATPPISVNCSYVEPHGTHHGPRRLGNAVLEEIGALLSLYYRNMFVHCSVRKESTHRLMVCF